MQAAALLLARTATAQTPAPAATAQAPAPTATGSLTGTVLDSRKSRIVFLVGQSGTVLVDDVKVWENTRQPGSPSAAAKP